MIFCEWYILYFNASSLSSTNYNDIEKVFDYAILSISNKCFQTSDMQFGFNQQHSTVVPQPTRVTRPVGSKRDVIEPCRQCE